MWMKMQQLDILKLPEQLEQRKDVAGRQLYIHHNNHLKEIFSTVQCHMLKIEILLKVQTHYGFPKASQAA